MRCPNCGGIVKHYLTDTQGKSYYHCSQVLTSVKRAEAGDERWWGSSCDTIVNDRGRQFTDHIVYRDGEGNMHSRKVVERKG
jgi:hypothetical protein